MRFIPTGRYQHYSTEYYEHPTPKENQIMTYRYAIIMHNGESYVFEAEHPGQALTDFIDGSTEYVVVDVAACIQINNGCPIDD